MHARWGVESGGHKELTPTHPLLPFLVPPLSAPFSVCYWSFILTSQANSAQATPAADVSMILVWEWRSEFSQCHIMMATWGPPKQQTQLYIHCTVELYRIFALVLVLSLSKWCAHRCFIHSIYFSSKTFFQTHALNQISKCTKVLGDPWIERDVPTVHKSGGPNSVPV